ncbi:hypothetical protein ACFE04_016360 [Oxalis oulophora]
MTAARLPIFYKQRDFYLYPAWTYAIPMIILKVPVSLLDSFLWTLLTYYVIGFSPEIQRLILGLFCLMVIIMFGGTIIPRDSLPGWLRWGFWATPASYAQIALSLNEFQAPRWQKLSTSKPTSSETSPFTGSRTTPLVYERTMLMIHGRRFTYTKITQINGLITHPKMVADSRGCCCCVYREGSVIKSALVSCDDASAVSGGAVAAGSREGVRISVLRVVLHL